jgi:hypothetical protein
VDLVTSTFYQKGRQTGTAKTQEGDGGPFRTVLRQNLFSYQRANWLNYREAVSFIFLVYSSQVFFIFQGIKGLTLPGGFPVVL